MYIIRFHSFESFRAKIEQNADLLQAEAYEQGNNVRFLIVSLFVILVIQFKKRTSKNQNNGFCNLFFALQFSFSFILFINTFFLLLTISLTISTKCSISISNNHKIGLVFFVFFSSLFYSLCTL